jgi:hypothetical protein
MKFLSKWLVFHYSSWYWIWLICSLETNEGATFWFLECNDKFGCNIFFNVGKTFPCYEWGEQYGVLHLLEVTTSLKFSNEVIHFNGSHCSQRPIVSRDVCLINGFQWIKFQIGYELFMFNLVTMPKMNPFSHETIT